MSGVKDGLVWWWDLNSADATITDQHSGLVLTRHQTPTTVTGGAPDGGDCISFGTAQGKYRNASVPKTIAYERGFTLNAWAFSTGTSVFGGRLINHRDLAQPNWYSQLGTNHSTVGDFANVFSANGTIRSANSGLPGSSLNTWVMLTLVDNGSTTLLYRNGVLVGTGTTSLGAFGTTNAPLAIGGHAWQVINDGDVDHRGRMSMAGVWDRPLTADEITWLYNSGTGRRYNALTYGERDLGGEVLWICPSLDDVGNGTVVARDLTTNRNHGILTNMDAATDWVSDTSNGGVRALDFDGVNDQVTAGTVNSFSFIQNTHVWTCSTWLKLSSTASPRQIIGNTPFDSADKGFALFYETGRGLGNGVIRAGVTRASGSSANTYQFRSPDNSISSTGWHHVCAGMSGQGLPFIFINGVSQAITVLASDTTLSTGNSSRTLGMGYSPYTSILIPLNGQLDDVRIYNRALTQTEITALASQRGYQRPVVNGIGGEALWICPSLDTFGNGTLLARDLTNQRNHGAMTSMAVGDWISDTVSGGARAINFDAVTKVIDLPNVGLLEPESRGSLSAWVRFSVLHAFSQVITKQLNVSVNNPIGLDLDISGSNSRTILSNGRSLNLATGSVISANIWYHFASTWDGSTLRLYVNGSFVSSTPQTLKPQVGTGAMSIGNVRNSAGLLGSFYGSGQLNGRVDDLRYFHRTLSASDVATLASQRGYNLPSNTRRRRYAGSYGL